MGVVARASDIKDHAKQIDRLLGAQLINQRVHSCSSDIKSAIDFLNGFLPFKENDPGFQLLEFLLLGRQRLALRSHTIALLLKLTDPAAQCGLNHPERATGFDMAVALIEHEACGLAFEFGGKGTTLLGHQTALSREYSRLNDH